MHGLTSSSEGNIGFQSQPYGLSFCIQFVFAPLDDQILQDPVPLNCPLALSGVHISNNRAFFSVARDPEVAILLSFPDPIVHE